MVQPISTTVGFESIPAQTPKVQQQLNVPSSPTHDRRWQRVEQIGEFAARVLQLVALCALCAYLTVRLLQASCVGYQVALWSWAFCCYLCIALISAKYFAPGPAIEQKTWHREQRAARKQLEGQRQELALLQEKVAHLENRLAGTNARTWCDEPVHLEQFSASALERVLSADRRELMLALVKVRAAPKCYIQWEKVLECKDHAFLPTSTKISYCRQHLLKWLEQRAVCPYTGMAVNYIIVPNAPKEEQFQAIKGGRLPKLKQQAQLRAIVIEDFQRRMRMRRAHALCGVNRMFGDKGNFLNSSALA